MKKKKMYIMLSQKKIDILNMYVAFKGARSQGAVLDMKISNLRVIRKPKIIPSVLKEELIATSFWLTEEQYNKVYDCMATWGITKNEFFNRLVEVMARELGM